MLSNLYSEYNTSANCTPVSPVANAIPQYNHHGCITGYVAKNAQDSKISGGVYYSGATTTDSGSAVYDHMGNQTGYLQGAGSDRVLMSGHGLSGSVQYYGAGSVSQHNMGIPTYDAKGKLTGTVVGKVTDSKMYVPTEVHMAPGYKAMADSEGNVIGYASDKNSVVENRQYDYYMRNTGKTEGLMAAKASMEATYYKDDKTNMYYKIPIGAIQVVDFFGNFVGYQTDIELVSVTGLTGLTQAEYNNIGVEEGMKAAATSENATYVSLKGQQYRIPTGAYVMHNTAGEFVGYKIAGGEIVRAQTMMAASSGMHSYYNKVSTTDGAVHITPGTVQDGSQGIVAGQAAADTSMDETYVMHAGHKFVIPVGCTAMFNSSDVFTGYMNASGVMVNVGVLMAKAGINAAQVGINAGNVGKDAGAAAATYSMNATYVEYMGQRFMIPVGAQIMYTSNNMFAGYKEIGGETVTVDTLMASSSTGMHSYYDKKVTTVGKVAGTTGVIAGKIGQNAGAKAAQVSMKATYYKYMGQTFTVPAGAQVMWTAGNFAGYKIGSVITTVDSLMAKVKTTDTVSVTYDEAKNCTPVSPVANGIPQYNHLGCITGYVVKNSSDGKMIKDTYVQYEGHTFMIPAGATESYDANYNFIGYELENGEVITANEMMVAAAQDVHTYYDKKVTTVGKTAGKMAETVSEDETYYHYNNMYFKIPANAVITYGASGAFMGYSLAGQQVMMSQMTGLDQASFTALHIGKYEGVQAAMTSMKKNGVGIAAGKIAANVGIKKAVVGIKTGKAAEVTSEKDTYVKYGDHVYQVPQGAVEQYNVNNNFTGYTMANGDSISATEMQSAAQQTGGYYDETMTSVGMNAGQAGVIAGQEAAKVSMEDTYVHYGGHVFQVPAGAIEMYNNENVFTGYTLTSGQTITIDQMMQAAQYSQVGVVEGQAAAATSMEATHVKYNGMIYAIPTGATATYDATGVFTGYYSAQQISGGVAVYEVLNGVSTLSGYHYSVDMLQGTNVISSSTVLATAATASTNATGCNPVSPVPHGMPQYNHHGCITGYVVKNSSDLMMLI